MTEKKTTAATTQTTERAAKSMPKSDNQGIVHSMSTMAPKLDTIRQQFRYITSRWQVLLHDALMVSVAWMLAYSLRYNLDVIPGPFLQQAKWSLPTVVLIHTLTNITFGVHRGIWRFISLPDLVRLLKAIALGTVLVAVILFFMVRLQYVPRSVFVLHGLLLLLFLAGPRLLYRLMKDKHVGLDSDHKVLIVGAGSAGERLARDLLRMSPGMYEPIAFVDDDKSKHGKEILGIRVLGDSTTIPLLAEKWKVHRVLIALPSATAAEMRKVVEWCERSNVPFRTMPKIHDILSGHANTNDLRPVQIEDLLGRDPVSLDWQGIGDQLNGKRVLVTGGGGSIGSELCRQITRLEPEQLLILDQSEFNLYSIGLELAHDHPNLPFTPVLADVCDTAVIDDVFSRWQPDIVFHAAAYKHVNLLQAQVREAVKNNVLGTRVIAEAAHVHGAEAVVLISTDKAVNPTSAMGATKRAAERFCRARATTSSTRYVTLRFGNVLGSAGSVVPLFKRQIEAGGPVTVTHPEVTRYFMTLAEACQLILQATVIGKGSEIYVLNMGEPIKIAYLAKQMIRLSGMDPEKDIKIEYTGLRPGEKLSEELFHSDEPLFETEYSKILRAQSRESSWELMKQLMVQVEAACASMDDQQILRVLDEVVPEYKREACASSVCEPRTDNDIPVIGTDKLANIGGTHG